MILDDILCEGFERNTRLPDNHEFFIDHNENACYRLTQSGSAKLLIGFLNTNR